MKGFEAILQKEVGYRQLLEGLRKKQTPFLAAGLSDIHKGHVAYSLACDLQRTALLLVPNDAMGHRLTSDINTMAGDGRAVFFPTRELVFQETEGVSLEYEHIRLGILGTLLRAEQADHNEIDFVVATVEAAVQHTLPPAEYKAHTIELAVGNRYSLEELTGLFVAAGYQRVSQVEGVSQFAVRGGILDIMPTAAPAPYRIEFWGDEIDTIATFDFLNQRRMDTVDAIQITPAREALITKPELFIKSLETVKKGLRGSYGVKAKERIGRDIQRLTDGVSLASADRYLSLLYSDFATLFDYCGERLLFAMEPISLKEAHKNYTWQLQEDIKLLLEDGVLFAGATEFAMPEHALLTHLATADTVLMDTFNRSLPDMRLGGMCQIQSVQLPFWSGDYALLREDLDDYAARKYSVAVLAGTPRASKALTDDLVRDGYGVLRVDKLQEPRPGMVYVLEQGLSAGFEYPSVRFALLTHTRAEIGKQKKARRSKEGKKLRSLSDLTPGDYVVHVTHGIGIFGGITQRNIQGVIKDFIQIRYAGTDALFVPVTQLDLVSKYIGAGEGVKVKLNKLHSLEWKTTKSKVKGAIKEMAKELTALYAKRMSAKGFAFSEDDNWQQEFEARFPYEETDDQLRSIAEVKADMQRPVPMDRLLCGDVGFGKTEVALRGIFKCVMDSKQCAVLVPTTILAWQHYQTFLRRLEGFPVQVELLSRFRTPKQQKEIIKKLKTGEIDVVVGTHRVVQKDVEFFDLGLCVIDEEQRFGVAHKERFKELRSSVDVLTLSATPIPRTLNMAMSGIRDMSTIEEAPQDRYPVQTYVMEYEQGLIIQAIQKELRRNGQVFYVHNRIDTIESCANRLRRALPEARILVAHGRMNEEEVSRIWRQLMEQAVDILVCTTIIETGVDVPNANTLIIEEADNYGLSQLYQLRGRVGRSTRRAYAYFTFRRGKALTEIATKRLSAIREFTTFGSGFRIAMRDLEIRGAGNILGAQQHGHMAAVGYDMYLRLLAEAIQEEAGEGAAPTTDCVIDIQVDAYIPEEYIVSLSQRIDMYKRIAAIASEEDSMDVLDELIDRFGDPPKAVKGLVDVALVRGTAAQLGITEINQTQTRLLLYTATLNMELASKVVTALGKRVLVNAGERPYFSVAITEQENPIVPLRETLLVMTQAMK